MIVNVNYLIWIFIHIQLLIQQLVVRLPHDRSTRAQGMPRRKDSSVSHDDDDDVFAID